MIELYVLYSKCCTQTPELFKRRNREFTLSITVFYDQSQFKIIHLKYLLKKKTQTNNKNMDECLNFVFDCTDYTSAG